LQVVVEWGLIGLVAVELAVTGRTTLQMLAVVAQVSLMEVLVPLVITL
jgi:hypothetical protein